MKKSIRLAVGVTLSAALGLGSQAALAQTNAIANGDWLTSGTWSAGVPSDTLAAAINGGRTVTVTGSLAQTYLADVGSIAGETGNLNIQGDLTIYDATPSVDPKISTLRLGQVAGSTGNLTMTSGQVFINEDVNDIFDNGDFIVGQNGSGNATVSGGQIIAGDEVLVGQNAGSNGTLTINGTGKVSAGRRNMQIGFGGADTANSLNGADGTVNISGSGQLEIGDTIFMGFGGADAGAGLAGGNGELNISESATVTVTGWMQSAFGNDSTSHITQSGGTVTVGGLLVHGARGDAIFDHTGGTFQANLIIIGDGVDNTTPHGTYNISGNAQAKSNLVMWVGAWGKGEGTVNQGGSSVVNVGALTVGRDGYGVYNMSGGTLNSNGGDGFAPNDHFIVGQVGNIDDTVAKGAGVFTQTAGTVVVKTGVFLGDFDSSEGTYKISGGSLTVGGGSHPNVEGYEDFIGDFSVGGALASNALVARVEPTNANDPQGQALAASGTFIVSGSAATINIGGNFLANPADKSPLRSESSHPGGNNSATLGFEIFNSTGTSLINVAGVADLDGAVVDLDLMNGYAPAVNATFDLLKASNFGATGAGTTQNVGTGMGYSLASEDASGWSLAVITSGSSKILRATFLGLPGIPGDFNSDGKVDGRDLLLWQRNTSVGSLADWKANYGTGSLAAVSAVPEPGSLVLIGAMGILTCLGRGRRA
jgi:hypothetical protein